MTIIESYIVFPNGELQEISHTLKINQIVDLNGFVLPTPLPTNKMLAYCVFKQRTKEKLGIVQNFFYLQQLSADELHDYV